MARKFKLTNIFNFPKHSLQKFTAISILVFTILQTLAENTIQNTVSIAPVLLPIITITLLISYIIISILMILKYLSDKQCLFLVPVICAFTGSVVLNMYYFSSYPEGFIYKIITISNYNDYLIGYFYRNIMLMITILMSALLYGLRKHRLLSPENNIITVWVIINASIIMVALSWLSSSYYIKTNIDLTHQKISDFFPFWRPGVMFVAWCVILIIAIITTRFRNMYWTGIYFVCISYMLMSFQLITSEYSTDNMLYRTRMLEVLSTLVFVFILFINSFILYKNSNTKYKNAYQNSIRDHLTMLYNRRYFYDALMKLIPCITVKNPLSIIVCDIDFFKSINDKYGHQHGDKVIQFIAIKIQSLLRQNDILARIGGEEFALLLPGVNEENAKIIAERICHAVSQHDSKNTDIHQSERITISMGIYSATDNTMTEDVYISRADDAMYKAKHAGRNCVKVWQQ
ncbi:diguanylate cyclase [[Enterobacter] lignolyticus SCF1]|uniref:diguanylate cyclase n=2 Tax=[Enterobacter] lignolyticus TaxID=1334193 RepID=E3GAB0_ENTLS|nr:diguanylate cyclase [[Enterobacter] lignolyticus SCF1]